MDKIVHFEIPVDEVERAKRFYAQAFGWQISGTGGPYHMVTTTPAGEDYRPKEPGAINGGMLARTGPVQAPVLTVGVDDMKAAVERVKAAGGTIVMDPFPVGNIGVSSYFKDPEGNVLGMWQSLTR